LVKNNFPKSLSSVIKPFVLSLSKHDRLDAGGRNFSVHPSTSSGRTEKFYAIHIGKLLMTVSLDGSLPLRDDRGENRKRTMNRLNMLRL